jgi:hypothetical protein
MLDRMRRFIEEIFIPRDAYSSLVAPGISKIVEYWVKDHQQRDAETPSVLLPTIPWSDCHDWERGIEWYDDPWTKSAKFRVWSQTAENTVEIPIELFYNDDYAEMRRLIRAGIPE